MHNDPVNLRDLWGLTASDSKNVPVTLHNWDPTPGSNGIINSKGEVGHTWLSIDGGTTPGTFGWGSWDDDVSDGKTHPGAILQNNRENAASQETSSYTFMMTQSQADALAQFYKDNVTAKTGYNLGGSAADPQASMCTEMAVNGLNASGGMTPEESAIINSGWNTWGSSFPDPLPSGYEKVGSLTTNLTSPNPNEMEMKIEQLNALKGVNP